MKAPQPWVISWDPGRRARRGSGAPRLGARRPAGAFALPWALPRGPLQERRAPPQAEAVTAIAKTGGDEGAAAVGDLLGSGAASTAVQRAALLETWRLGARAPIPTLMREARNPDPLARGNPIYPPARLPPPPRVSALVDSLPDSEVAVRAVARSEERRVGKECRSRWSP